MPHRILYSSFGLLSLGTPSMGKGQVIRTGLVQMNAREFCCPRERFEAILHSAAALPSERPHLGY